MFRNFQNVESSDDSSMTHLIFYAFYLQILIKIMNFDWHETGFNLPPYSPDLSVLDYFLNERVKKYVHDDGRIDSFAELEQRIHTAFEKIT